MRRLLSGALLLVLSTVALAGQQSIEERVRELERKNERMRERLDKSESENSRWRNRDLEKSIETYLEVSAQESAKTGVATRKNAWLTIYGFIRFDLYYNSARTNHICAPTTVLPEAGNPNDDQFAMDVRLTRIGFLFDFGELAGAKVTGKIEIDFQNFVNGVAESRETPRIRHAYIQFGSGTTTIRVGQDWDTISPLIPGAFPQALMWNAGNLGDRRPQVKLIFGQGHGLSGTVAIGLTGAVNNQDLDAAPAGPGQPFAGAERDGFDSGLPHGQVRLAYSGTSHVEEMEFTVGGWGMIGLLETDNLFAGEDEFVTWTVGFDFVVPLTAKLSLRGEVWVGQALGDHRGNIGATVNRATGKEIEGYGGWIELVLRLEALEFHAGFTIDDPDDADVPAGAANRNQTAYAGVIKWLADNMKVGFDIVWWETTYSGGGKGDMIRFDLYVQINF